MSLANLIDRTGTIAARVRAKLAWFPPLLLRITIGGVFIVSGWAHIHDLPGLTQNFVEWNIPMPAFNAALSSYTELICGSLILVGLFTRLASIPLIITMIVAIVAAQRPNIDDVVDLVNLKEFAYIAILVPLAIWGSGLISIDQVIGKLWAGKRAGGTGGASRASAT